MFNLPPLTGGHKRRSPPREHFAPADVPAATSQRHQPSAKRRKRAAPPPDDAPWEAARPWITVAFDRHHGLLKSVLDAYLSRGTAGKCRSLDSFLHAFYDKEGKRPSRALAAASQFLLMELWRDTWMQRDETVLPAERRAARRLMDPLLDVAATHVSESRPQLHRESVEFCQAVVAEASRRLHEPGRRDSEGDELDSGSCPLRVASHGRPSDAAGNVPVS